MLAAVSVAALFVCHVVASREFSDMRAAVGCPLRLHTQNKACVLGDYKFHAGTVNVEVLLMENLAVALAAQSGLDDDMKAIIPDLHARFVKRRPTIREQIHNITNAAVRDYWDSALKSGVSNLWRVVEAVQEANIATGGHLNAATLQLLNLAAAGSIFAGGVLNAFGVLALGPQLLLWHLEAQRQATKDWEATNNFALALFKKGNCLSDLFGARSAISALNMKTVVVNMCDPDTGALLSAMQRANDAMVDLFNFVGNIGKCLYTTGSEGKKATYLSASTHTYKVRCGKAIIPKLRRFNRMPGILFSAMTLAVAYGRATDEILEDPRFGNWLVNAFRVGGPEASGFLDHAVLLASDPEWHAARQVACASLVASQQAFAESFNQLVPLLEIWIRTYALEISSSCGEAFKEIPEADEASDDDIGDFCKWPGSLGVAHPCTTDAFSPVWK